MINCIPTRFRPQSELITHAIVKTEESSLIRVERGLLLLYKDLEEFFCIGKSCSMVLILFHVCLALKRNSSPRASKRTYIVAHVTL
jgi:hypothetical protein